MTATLPVVVGLAGTPQVLAGAAGARAMDPQAIAAADPAASIQLRLRRLPDAVEVVLQGVGPAPVLQQSANGSAWLGSLTTAQPLALPGGSQTFSLPEAGLQSISLQGNGSTYQVQVTPMAGMPLGRPVVSADGRDLVVTFATAPQASLQSARLDLRTPGRVPQPVYAPPLQPRAVAPPLGDMAVGSMVLRNRSYINVSGPSVSMTMRNAPAKDVLMALAQMGGYGFVYVNEDAKQGQAAAAGEGEMRPISISFRGENYSRALNSVLLAAGLQGKVEGNMILAGPAVLGKSFGAQVSKIFRLNQASAASAADYLASLGATINKVSVITNSVTQGVQQQSQVAGGSTSQQTQSQNITTTETYGASTGPLKGLTGTTDSRLQTITLVGDPQLVAVAENYLRQIDLRQRQVALSVKILDVSLDNNKEIDNSFAFRYGNNFIVNDSGRLLGAFNSTLPPSQDQFKQLSGDAQNAKPVIQTLELGQENVTRDPTNPAPINPGRAYAKDNFYDFIRATILSSSTKVLASPTLILSENQDEIKGGAEASAQLSTGGSGGGSGGSSGSGNGLGSATIGRPRANESFVTVGEQVITDYTVSNGTQGNGNSCEPQFGIAGLTFGARVSKIDDNGFVTFTISPQISATTRQQQVQGCGPIDILSVRRLDTGSARVRDGQTLILTGVISDTDSQTVQKWPILGDIPLIGQFFRNSNGNRRKRELVILVTPRIINDTEGGTYGYGYQPTTRDTRQLMSAPAMGSGAY